MVIGRGGGRQVAHEADGVEAVGLGHPDHVEAGLLVLSAPPPPSRLYPPAYDELHADLHCALLLPRRHITGAVMVGRCGSGRCRLRPLGAAGQIGAVEAAQVAAVLEQHPVAVPGDARWPGCTLPGVPAGTPGRSIAATTFVVAVEDVGRRPSAMADHLQHSAASGGSASLVDADAWPVAGRRASAQVRPCFDVDVVGQAEHPLGDDVALHVAGAAADGERRARTGSRSATLAGRSEAVQPRPTPSGRRASAPRACRALEVLGQGHDRLAVLVGEDLADRCLGPGGSPWMAAVTVRSRMRRRISASMWSGRAPLAQVRVADTTLRAGPGRAGHRRSGRCPTAHRRPRQRHPLVAERHLGQAPAVVLLAHQVLGGQAHVGEEHLVEGVAPGHLDDGADLDARRRPSGR